MSSAACIGDDTGNCCKAFREGVMIPEPTVAPDGSPIDNISVDPGFDCDGLACVVYGGSPKAYCTKPCQNDGNCPDGFECKPVLQSDPGPDSNVQPDDKFCVKAMHMCVE